MPEQGIGPEKRDEMMEEYERLKKPEQII